MTRETILDPRNMTDVEVQAAYDAEVASIEASCRLMIERGESGDGHCRALAMNEARRWLDNALSVCWRAFPGRS